MGDTGRWMTQVAATVSVHHPCEWRKQLRMPAISRGSGARKEPQEDANDGGEGWLRGRDAGRARVASWDMGSESKSLGLSSLGYGSKHVRRTGM